MHHLRALTYHFEDTSALLSFLVVAPLTTVAFSRRRGVRGWPTAGLAVLALAATACWIALLGLYMMWEVGNDWRPTRT